MSVRETACLGSPLAGDNPILHFFNLVGSICKELAKEADGASGAS